MGVRVLHPRGALVVLGALLVALGGAPLEAASADHGPRTTATAVDYVVPVPGGVARGFEPPTSAYGPGHRGVDLAARPGDAVAAAADGRVVHAGAVARTTWVSVDHADGIRTAYGPLTELAVARGDEVVAGGELGRLASGGHGHVEADEGLHFSARRDGVHVDPLPLFAPGRPSLVGPGSRAPHGDPGRAATLPSRITPAAARPSPVTGSRSLPVDALPAGPLP